LSPLSGCSGSTQHDQQKRKNTKETFTSVLSIIAFDNTLTPVGERVARVASRVRGFAETMIVRNYAGHDVIYHLLSVLLLNEALQDIPFPGRGVL
jgi:hypothetical protein